MSRLNLVGAWILVVVIATTLTWQIVSAADARVSDRPVAPLEVGTPIVSLAGSGSTTTTPVAPDTTSPSNVSAPIPSPSTTTTVAPTLTPAPTTTSTSPPAVDSPWQVRSVATAGGTVVVSYRPGEVVFQTATPAPGFKVEIDKAGPPKVRVEFENDAIRVEINLEWRDGDLDIDISESGES